MDPISIIAGLVAAGTAIYGYAHESNVNRKNRDATRWQNLANRHTLEATYNRERTDALADWNAQNAYNSPEEQMNRLRQAGLNPHLVYGKGADATADAIRSSKTGNQSPEGFQMNPMSNPMSGIRDSLYQMYDLKAKKAQVDNVNESTALMQQESLFKQAGTAKSLQETARSKFDLGQAQELKDNVIMASKLKNEKLKADTRYTIDGNQRQELANTQNVKLTIEKILSEKIARSKSQKEIDMLSEQLTALKQQESIRSYEDELSRIGIHKNDPWYFRAMMNTMHGNLKLPDFIPNDKKIQKFFNGKDTNGTSGTY